MSTKTAQPRIAGCQTRLSGPIEIESWTPPSKAAVQALPPLAPPPARGWQVAEPMAPTADAVPATPPDLPAPPASAATPAPNALQLLGQVPPQLIASFLSQEHPQTVALILAQLEPTLAGGILGHLPEPVQPDVVHRIATMGQITPAVLEDIERSLGTSLRNILGSHLKVGGPKVAADIINEASSSVERHILTQMDTLNPEMTESVRNLMFVFADIAKLSDREIQTLMAEVDQRDLIVALKDADDQLKHRILGNFSEQVRAHLVEEMNHVGPLRLSEVEDTRLRIVQQARVCEEQGKIIVVRGSASDSRLV